jgi:broad specificity phosphatase PhoE
MKLFFVRHGAMAGDPFVCPERPVSGCLSAETGIPQARAAAEALRDERIDLAFSSPYGRALQTAEIVLEGRDTPIRVLDFLREWQPNPDLRELPSTRFEEICARDRERYAEETWKTELGEGCFDMYARIVPPFLKELDAAGLHSRMGGYVPDAAAADLRLAVFAHGGSLNVLLSHILGIPPAPIGRIRFEETGAACVAFSERKGIFYPALVVPPPCRPPPAGTVATP